MFLENPSDRYESGCLVTVIEVYMKFSKSGPKGHDGVLNGAFVV